MKAYNYKRLKKKFLAKYNSLSPERQALVRDYILKRKQKHKFHLVAMSPWPVATAFSAFIFFVGLLSWIYKLPLSSFALFIGFSCVILSMFLWFRDIIRESSFCGYHTKEVQLNIRYGFTLFILSEIMFFFAFFWSLLHFTLCPSIFSGNIWPPEGIINFFISQEINDLLFADEDSIFFYRNYPELYSVWAYKNFSFKPDIHGEYYHLRILHRPEFVDGVTTFGCLWRTLHFCQFYLKFFYYDLPFWPDYYYCLDDNKFKKSSFFINLYSPGVLVSPLSIPLLNTIILLSSGVFLTYSHISLKLQNFVRAIFALTLTVIFGIYFFICQLFEYMHAGFSINDGIYGSTFYMLTGFHGFHVLVGTIFLLICLIRFLNKHFTPTNHFGFEAAIWYWHFVDVVWVLLFFLIYYWPNIFFFKETRIVVSDDAICINQPICELIDEYSFNINFLVDNPKFEHNIKLIELILVKNKINILEVSSPTAKSCPCPEFFRMWAGSFFNYHQDD